MDDELKSLLLRASNLIEYLLKSVQDPDLAAIGLKITIELREARLK